LLSLCLDRYSTSGRYSNSVTILRESLLHDEKNDWCYNQLAWLQATCSDGAIRNGSEAILAAREACELTQWRNRICLDTLAAAYGESGDFKRAIEFEEQALRIGGPKEPRRNEMEKRLSMYKQSKPFRQTDGSKPSQME
jgi:tetratricopeptide (TPR) repeat protein